MTACACRGCWASAMMNKPHQWTAGQLDRLRELYRQHSLEECKDMLNAEFGLTLRLTQVRSATRNHGIRSGRTGRFVQGNEAWNKGKRFENAGGRDTRFKKGQQPHNAAPVGTEQWKSDGYLWVKVAEPSRWIAKHRLIWERANGPIPEGHVLLFLNQDRTDIRLDNLAMIRRSLLAVVNKHGLLSQSAELTRTGLLVAEVKKKAYAAKLRLKGAGRRSG